MLGGEDFERYKMCCMTAAKFEEKLKNVVPHMQSDEMTRHPFVKPAIVLSTFLMLAIWECQPGVRSLELNIDWFLLSYHSSL